MTPELGFEGWVEFHQEDRGGQGLRKWEKLGKKREADASGLALLRSSEWEVEGFIYRGDFERQNNKSGLDSTCSRL